MMKLAKYIFSIFLIVSSLNSYSADKIDSLLHVIENSTDEKKVDALVQISELYKFLDFDNVLKYANDALTLSEKIDYPLGKAMAHTNIAYSLSDLGKYNEAIDHYSKSITLFQLLKDENREAIAHNDIAYIYQSQGFIENSIESYAKSLKLLEKFDDKKSEAACLGNLGLLYHYQKNYALALEYYKTSLKIREELGNEKGIAASLNNIGGVYFSQNQLLEAKEYFFKSLSKRKKVNDQPGIAECLTNISEIYREQKEYATSLEYLLQAEKIQTQINDKLGLASTINSIGVIYELSGDLSNARKYLIESNEIAHKMGSVMLIKNSTIALSNLYSKTDEHDKAYELIIEHYKMKGFLENSENSKKATKAALQYEFDKKLNENKLAQAKKDIIKDADLAEQKIISYVFAAGLVLLIILSIVIMKSLNAKKKTNKRISLQKSEIEEKSHKLEEALTNITDSLIYAKKIQQALLRTKEQISKNIPPHFILFKPKDIVSGDFYWTYEKENHMYIAAVDCTGHGVPGALMSMLGITFLNSINATDEILTPAEILNQLRDKIVKELSQNSEAWSSKDGMDMSLVKINTSTNEAQWAGAKNPIWIVHNKELKEIKGDRQAINYTENPQPFTDHSIKLNKGDHIYLFTDGYPDQFGGEKGKKLKYKEFRKMFLSIYQKPINEQKDLLDNLFNDWKQDLEQVDDVCVIGLQIN